MHAVREHSLTDIWPPQAAEAHGWKAAGLRVQRVLAAAVTEFFSDQCLLRRAAAESPANLLLKDL
jgi:hypothetical protein